MKQARNSDFSIVFTKLNEYDVKIEGSDPTMGTEATDEELKEIRRLREIVNQTLESPSVYFTRN